MSSPDTIDRVLGLLAVAYPTSKAAQARTPDERKALLATVELYHRALADIDDDLLVAAVEHHIGQSQWFPTVSELRECALNLVTYGTPEADQAWGEVIRQFRLTGQYRTPQFSDPLIAETVRQIGWLSLCNSENQMADRAHFLRMYDALRKREASAVKLMPGPRAFLASEAIKQLAGRLSLNQPALPSGKEGQP